MNYGNKLYENVLQHVFWFSIILHLNFTRMRVSKIKEKSKLVSVQCLKFISKTNVPS